MTPPAAPVTTTASVQSVLGTLPRQRLVELGRQFAVSLDARQDAPRDPMVQRLCDTKQLTFRKLLEWMHRDELRAACKRHGVEAKARGRSALAAALLQAHGDKESAPPPPLFASTDSARHVPKVGDIVAVRHRQYLVESVAPPAESKELTRVDLVCLDDDNQGAELSILWELELGAKVSNPHQGLGSSVGKLDPPRYFAAYLHALKWNSVTATDSELFQSPFRAGIQLHNHQLIPLKRALELPRANLFIADDVGLGKTIEAGLVLQELQLRQRVNFVLIVCPASICLQWRSEMEKRFGQQFEIYDRGFVARRRSERGFGVNPWTTHNRFIISYQTLRRPEYREPLEQHLRETEGVRLKKSLLVLDEAHTVAPASASKYAIDSRLTKMVRHMAPSFENRLFLSATPHNGHSNSFSALMELLDPQRFTRGVPIEAGSEALGQVMVRRLKRDLQEALVDTFPTRHIVPVTLRQAGQDGWAATFGAAEAGPLPGSSDPFELRLSELLQQYTELMKPKRGRGKLVFVNLQKRLLSSTEAFHRTLSKHAESVEAQLRRIDADALAAAEAEARESDAEGDGADALGEPEDTERQEPDEAIDTDEDASDRQADAEVAEATRALTPPSERAKQLLNEMLELSGEHRYAPDAKVLALIQWIAENQCPAVTPAGADDSRDTQWKDARLIIFTEYADTKRYLTQVLTAAIEGTAQADERIEGFHGAMSDQQRQRIQRQFNGNPSEFPVRILIATDAAREGLNLQNYCANLFHFDIPWNPARMEQRNGRIDRTLQPAKDVYCHYFVYPERTEDAVLDKLVHKVDVIQKQLGTLGDVVMQRIEKTLHLGIDAKTQAALDAADELPELQQTASSELDSQRAAPAQLQEDIDEAGRILNRSMAVMDFKEELLRDAVNVGLELSGAQGLSPIASDAQQAEELGSQQAFSLPDLPASWEQTLDTLRPPRDPSEPLWEWRKRPPQPVVFKALGRMGEERVHLHLEHPFVQRILSRFVAQGFSANDLSRVTVVPNRHDNLVRVIAFGRISLFGPGAARLHDKLVSVAAQWLETKKGAHLKPFAEEADRRAVQTLESLFEEARALPAVPEKIQRRLAEGALADFEALWPHVRDEADAEAHAAKLKLKNRGQAEAEALRKILLAQRARIERAQQLSFDFGSDESPAAKQLEEERQSMRQRLERIGIELEHEPEELEELYRVSLERLEPVGLVYLWPTTRL